jgi:hypothetical protein
MVRHGEAPDPKADMMYPDGLGRVISGAGYSGAGYSGAGYSGAGHFRAGYSPNTACQPPLLSAFQPIMPCNKNIMPPALAHGLAQNTGLQSSSDLLGYR